MPKTALELTAQEWRAYRPGTSPGRSSEAQTEKRQQQAWLVARQAAQLLRREFGASKVVVFGSLARGGRFGPWSDIDLAAWDIPADRFYRAVAAVTGLSFDFKVDLLELETCKPALRHVVEREGIEL